MEAETIRRKGRWRYVLVGGIDAKAPNTVCTVITNPDDPKFDLELFVDKWERENEPRK